MYFLSVTMSTSDTKKKTARAATPVVFILGLLVGLMSINLFAQKVTNQSRYDRHDKCYYVFRHRSFPLTVEFTLEIHSQKIKL